MARYELMFDIGDLEDSVVEELYAGFDALVSDHRDGTSLTITSTGPTAVVAAKKLAEVLEADYGVEFRRMVEDLVDRRDIANRSGATPQAVGMWIRGDRHGESPFPSTFSRVAGGVWLWGEVNTWLRRIGRAHDSDVAFPCRSDHDEVNAWIAERNSSRRLSSVRKQVKFPSGASAIDVGVTFSSGQKSRVMWTELSG